MIRAAHKSWAPWVFDPYMDHIFWKDFSRFHWELDFQPAQDSAVLVLGNHFSWWDGFIGYQINRKSLKRRFHIMMLEEELAKRRFFSYLGAFSIKKNARGMVETLNYTAELLRDPANLVLMFPQGRIESQHKEPLIWEPGLQRILDNVQKPVQVVFSAALTDYLAQRKPALDVYWHSRPEYGQMQLKELEVAYNAFYHRCRMQQAAQHA